MGEFTYRKSNQHNHPILLDIPAVIESELILESLDNLVKLGSETALEFGWLSNQYFDAEKPALISEFGTEKAALHETISFIHDREAAYIVARSTVADRMRVCRWMDREKYNDIVAETGTHPSFHQLRACLVTDENGINDDACEEMLQWCVTYNWPTVAEIREHRDGKDETEPEDKHWNRLVKMAKTVSLDMFNSVGRYEAAALVLSQDNEEKSHA
jgi:hypothetical protein